MRKPRLGFLGVGWIGRDRMAAMLATGLVEAIAIADPATEMLDAAHALAPEARCAGSLDEMLGMGLDGVVIATPSADHAAQSIAALEAGVAVFCQKPLGRMAREARAVVDAAQAADRLLAVDFSYRFTEGMERIAGLVRDDALGAVQLVDLVFHNAYGPDKPWFYDKAQSGGGCVMDLGVHLVDLALWTLGFPDVVEVTADLRSGGRPLQRGAVEDLATATLRLANGVTVRLACSWRLHAGCDAVIEAAFYGTAGGARLRNVGGSFFDFSAERMIGTRREALCAGPDAWGGRAAEHWAASLGAGNAFDPAAEQLVAVAHVLDRIYATASAVD